MRFTVVAYQPEDFAAALAQEVATHEAEKK